MRILIREIRKEKGIKLEALAQLTGISKSTINDYENGLYMPRFDYLLKIAKALEVSLEDIYEE